MPVLAQSSPLDSLRDLAASHLDAVITAVTFVAAVLAWLIDRYWLRRKLIAYRVHLDQHIDLTHAPDDADLKLLRGGKAVQRASMMLVRVRNAGSLDIHQRDVTSPLTLTFPGREVVGVDVPEANPAALRNVIRVGISAAANTITLPEFTLNKKDRFKLLVLLDGQGQDPVVGECRIDGGNIVSESNRVGPSRRSLAFGGTCLVLAGVLFGLVWDLSEVIPVDVRCASGSLAIEGSTAFSPLVLEMTESYASSCSGADITVTPTGSLVGVRELASEGLASSEVRSSRIAVSDGPASGEYQSLVPRPIAVGVFAVAVNRASDVFELSQQEIQDIYRGVITNWNQVGGRDQRISLVSRGSESGTRRAFEKTVLGAGEPAVSSNDCINKDRAPDSPIVRCERGNTESLLQEINRIPGAIGYAEKSAVAKFSDVRGVQLNGREADIEAVKQNAYPFFEVEYFYTYGEPQADTLISAFLDYLSSGTAKNILRRDGYTPCLDGENNLMGTLCQQ